LKKTKIIGETESKRGEGKKIREAEEEA